MANEFAVAAHVRGNQQTSLRHGLERLQRCYQVGQTHRLARVDQHIDEGCNSDGPPNAAPGL